MTYPPRQFELEGNLFGSSRTPYAWSGLLTKPQSVNRFVGILNNPTRMVDEDGNKP